MTQPPFPASRSQIGVPPLTHLDEQRQAQMVDVSSKTATVQQAIAVGRVRMAPETFCSAWLSPSREGSSCRDLSIAHALF